MRSTKIVATIGPASQEPDVLTAMIVAGMDVARLNFAHGTRDQHAETAGLIREAAERAGREVAILGDLPGPKLRLGPVAGGVAELGRGTRRRAHAGRGRGHPRAPGGGLEAASPSWSTPGTSATSPMARCGCGSTRSPTRT